MSLADKCIVVGCFVCWDYDKILMETGKFSDNIRVTENGLVSGVESFFSFLNYFVWLRITDEGSVPKMRIWYILLLHPIEYGVYILVELSFYICYMCPRGLFGPSAVTLAK